jgi:hypothetical protein
METLDKGIVSINCFMEAARAFFVIKDSDITITYKN